MSAYLEYTDNGELRQLDCRDVITIGRDQTNDIALKDSHISRRHAILYRSQDGTFYVSDEGSSNGTFVNASRVTLPCRLKDGDLISIGATNIRFRHPEAAATPGAGEASAHATVIVTQHVEVTRYALLVADIRGFTSLAEAMPVRDLTEIMNRWFRESTRCVRERHGVIDKFLGDCVYARWEADRQPAQALREALSAACELNRITLQLNTTHPKMPHQLKLGAGINIGSAALGTDQGRTAIGDAVNLTFRLQEQTKKLGCHLLLNREAYLHLPREHWAGREQTIQVAGKTQPLDVWGMSFDEAQKLLAQWRSDTTPQ
jgi:adenylate cyclase